MIFKLLFLVIELTVLKTGKLRNQLFSFAVACDGVHWARGVFRAKNLNFKIPHCLHSHHTRTTPLLTPNKTTHSTIPIRTWQHKKRICKYKSDCLFCGTPKPPRRRNSNNHLTVLLTSWYVALGNSPNIYEPRRLCDTSQPSPAFEANYDAMQLTELRHSDESQLGHFTTHSKLPHRRICKTTKLAGSTSHQFSFIRPLLGPKSWAYCGGDKKPP